MIPEEHRTQDVQARAMLRAERARIKERQTRKERSMAEAKAALAATYAKYGIKPLESKPSELPTRVPIDIKPRRQLSPEQAAERHKWLNKDRL